MTADTREASAEQPPSAEYKGKLGSCVDRVLVDDGLVEGYGAVVRRAIDRVCHGQCDLSAQVTADGVLRCAGAVAALDVYQSLGHVMGNQI
jgi:hypothetical protein